MPNFGFTETEVLDLLTKSLENQPKEEIQKTHQSCREWFNGYRLGENILYNPWSIINFLAEGYILKPYFFDEERAIPHSPYLCRVSVGPQTQEFIFEELKDLIQSDLKTLDE